MTTPGDLDVRTDLSAYDWRYTRPATVDCMPLLREVVESHTPGPGWWARLRYPGRHRRARWWRR